MYTWLVIVGYINQNKETNRLYFTVMHETYEGADAVAKSKFLRTPMHPAMDSVREWHLLRMQDFDSTGPR